MSFSDSDLESSSSSSFSSSSFSSSSFSSSDEEELPTTDLFTQAMRFREKARNNGNARLANTYLLIAAAKEFNQLKRHATQLCNLLFLNMLMIEAKVGYSHEKEPGERRRQRNAYHRLRNREHAIRDLIRTKLQHDI